MVGNAAEEGLLGQIANPSHGDPLRVVALASFVAGGLAYLAVRWALPALTIFGGIVVGLAVCLMVAWVLSNWVRQRRQARLAAELEMRRAEQSVETEARIAAMKRAGGPTT